MMAGHGANPIFFKKNKELEPPPTPLHPITSHFCLNPHPPFPPQSGRHMCITPSGSQQGIACSKLTIETLEQGVKYVQSKRNHKRNHLVMKIRLYMLPFLLKKE